MMRWINVLFVIVITCLLVITGWHILSKENINNKENEGIYDGLTLEDLNFTVENYPDVDGSTSTHPLDVIIACKILNVSYNWNWFMWDGTRRVVPNASEPGKEYISENITKKVVHHGTHSAYENLINGTADLILVARLPSEDELDLAESIGVKLETKAIALDAFVFILNESNEVNNLNIEQIKKIYTGEITNWSEVGGNEADINPYQRNDNSGSQELMKELVMKGLDMIDAPELILYGMMGPINRLSRDENGIGYSVYFFEEFMAPNERIKLCGVNGIFPNYENIRTRRYPFTTEVYAVIRADLDKENKAYELFDWLLSPEGQEIVKESGYVPIK